MKFCIASVLAVAAYAQREGGAKSTNGKARAITGPAREGRITEDCKGIRKQATEMCNGAKEAAKQS